MKIRFVNLDVQFKGSPPAITEVTGSDMICGAGLCSIQRTVVHRGVTGVVTQFCVSILSYTHIYKHILHIYMYDINIYIYL